MTGSRTHTSQVDLGPVAALLLMLLCGPARRALEGVGVVTRVERRQEKVADDRALELSQRIAGPIGRSTFCGSVPSSPSNGNSLIPRHDAATMVEIIFAFVGKSGQGGGNQARTGAASARLPARSRGSVPNPPSRPHP